MTLRVRFRPRASDELAAAIAWSEGQREGRGARLLAEIDRTLALIARTPGGGTPWRDRTAVRTWRVRRFPYLIIYVATDEEVEIIAVAHHRRRPGYWKR